MPAIALRQDFDAARLRALARSSKDARQVRRLLALAAVYDGASRAEAAALGGMDRQLLRDWALRFNAEGPGGLIDRKAPGARSKLTPEQLSAVVRLVEDGPIPAIHGVVRWRLIDLVGWIYDEYGVSLDPSRLGRILKALGYARLSARPKGPVRNFVRERRFNIQAAARVKRSSNRTANWALAMHHSLGAIFQSFCA